MLLQRLFKIIILANNVGMNKTRIMFQSSKKNHKTKHKRTFAVINA